MAALTALGIAAGVAGTASAARSAKRATEAQTAGVDASIEERRRQFDLTREDFSGARGRGEDAGNQLNNFLGLNGQDAEQGAIDSFNESPGQKFLRERRERATVRNASATGGLKGGNVQRALAEESIGLSQQFLGERKDRLAGVAGMGLDATATGAVIGSNISGGISADEAGRGNVVGSGIRERSDIRESGLARIAGAFTGSSRPGGFIGGSAPSGGGSGAFGLTKRFVNPLTGR